MTKTNDNDDVNGTVQSLPKKNPKIDTSDISTILSMNPNIDVAKLNQMTLKNSNCNLRTNSKFAVPISQLSQTVTKLLNQMHLDLQQDDIFSIESNTWEVLYPSFRREMDKNLMGEEKHICDECISFWTEMYVYLFFFFLFRLDSLFLRFF